MTNVWIVRLDDDSAMIVPQDGQGGATFLESASDTHVQRYDINQGIVLADGALILIPGTGERVGITIIEEGEHCSVEVSVRELSDALQAMVKTPQPAA